MQRSIDRNIDLIDSFVSRIIMDQERVNLNHITVDIGFPRISNLQLAPHLQSYWKILN